MNNTVYFDGSLPKFVDLIVSEWGEEPIKENFFLREASGRLSFVVEPGHYNLEARSKLAAKASEVLGSYTDDDGFAVTTAEELFDDNLKSPTVGWLMPVAAKSFTGSVRLVDRRVVGSDWLRKPATRAPGPTRLVFASLKGGVGRSTALCVLAAHLLSEGKRVLALDMDLEAPGLGVMLLSEETLPPYGLLDYMVEAGITPVPEEFYVDMLAPSWLAAGRGSLTVVPALGQQSMENPINVLAKLARAYLDQGTSTFADRMSALLDHFSTSGDYDVILVDARAGLHETTPSAIFGIGAEVFLFGVDQTQTFRGYDVLFSHLGTLPKGEWSQRLHFVQSKAPVEQSLRKQFADRMTDLAQRHLGKKAAPQTVSISVEALRSTFELDWIDDEQAARDAELIELLDGDENVFSVVAIAESADFRVFDPFVTPDSLTKSHYSSTYGPFLETVSDLIEAFNKPADQVPGT